MSHSKTSYLEVASKLLSRTNPNDEEALPYEIRLEQEDQPFFPYSPSVSYRFTNVSMYSSGNVEQSLFTADLLSSYFEPSELPSITVTDGTSCIGGNTWAFASTFGSVNAVELNFLHLSFLQHNLSEMGMYNVNYYHDNYISQIGKLRQQVLFLDPPWGGIQYRKHPEVGLRSPSGIFYSVPQLLYTIPSTGSYSPQVICIKLPRNYQTQGLRKLHYPFKKIIILKTKEGAVLYKLLLFSKHQARRSVSIPTFAPIRYKKFHYTRV